MNTESIESQENILSFCKLFVPTVGNHLSSSSHIFSFEKWDWSCTVEWVEDEIVEESTTMFIKSCFILKNWSNKN
jgi:hypothetical protein